MDRIVCLPHADALVALCRGIPHRGVRRLPHRHRTELACCKGKAGGDDNEVREEGVIINSLDADDADDADLFIP